MALSKPFFAAGSKEEAPSPFGEAAGLYYISKLVIRDAGVEEVPQLNIFFILILILVLNLSFRKFTERIGCYCGGTK